MRDTLRQSFDAKIKTSQSKTEKSFIKMIKMSQNKTEESFAKIKTSQSMAEKSFDSKIRIIQNKTDNLRKSFDQSIYNVYRTLQNGKTTNIFKAIAKRFNMEEFFIGNLSLLIEIYILHTTFV